MNDATLATASERIVLSTPPPTDFLVVPSRPLLGDSTGVSPNADQRVVRTTSDLQHAPRESILTPR